jgi:hypothetical protein
MKENAAPGHSHPRFCKNCGCAAADNLESKLCPECGDLLYPQGYCEVCERHWCLPKGAKCPKHDLVLRARPQPAALGEVRGDSIKWVTVGRFPTDVAAAGARIRLEAEDIPTFLEGERMAGLGAYSVATGGLKLQVPEHLVADARIILSQRWGPKSEKDKIEEL